MGLITVDPSQKKTVAALLGVLVVAVGVTIVRIEPVTVAEPAAQQQSQPSAERTACSIDEPARDRSRNPFERPEGFGAEMPPDGFRLERDPLLGASREPLRVPEVEPLPVMGVSVTKQEPRPTGGQVDAGQPGPRGAGAPAAPVPHGSRPDIVLLATIKSPSGYGAVIRINESAARVVQVGDVIEGGFRVTVLTEDHAALSDGRETIIAKRPHP